MSAEAPTGLREARRLETTRALKSAARRLTIERGLAGFTIDELCEEVGVSRRTFFNYFQSKELAVVGVPVREDFRPCDEAFVADGPGGLGTLVDAFVALQLCRWQRLDLSPGDVPELVEVLRREPHLHQTLFELGEIGERDDLDLIARREGLDPDDPRARAAIHVSMSVLRAATTEAFRTGESDVDGLIRLHLDAVRALFA